MIAKELDSIISLISRLPGMGEKSATRIIIHLLKHKSSVLSHLIEYLKIARDNTKFCKICHNIDVNDICSICSDKRRDKDTICIVCDITDLWAIEKAHFFNGVYHVLGGKLSAIDGVTPSDLNINTLSDRLASKSVKEVIIATSADIDGQTTLFYTHDQIKSFDHVKITTLSHGVPIGTCFEYLDQNTIITAFNRRSEIQ